MYYIGHHRLSRTLGHLPWFTHSLTRIARFWNLIRTPKRIEAAGAKLWKLSEISDEGLALVRQSLG